MITYLIAESRGARTKIGKTENKYTLSRRLTNLQQGNARPLRVKHYWEGEEWGYEAEQRILEALKEWRVTKKSEWVRLTWQQVVQFVETGELPVVSSAKSVSRT